MQLPNYLKVIWWLVLLVALSWLLNARLEALENGRGVAIDGVILVIWLGLVLAPIFQEINLFGVKLKQEIQSLKQEVQESISSLRNEVRTSIRTEVSPHFTFPYPPPDAQLPALEERIKSALRIALDERGITPHPVTQDEVSVDDNIGFLFATRHNIEKEVRRLWQSRVKDDLEFRRTPFHRIVRDLVESQVIDPRIANAISEVYSVCSPAIHGEEITAAQMGFVRDVAPGLISALRSIS